MLFNPVGTVNQNQGIVRLQQWFTNYEILKMITHDNAELLSLSGPRNPYPGDLGVIKEGALADVVIVKGNVLEDISLLGEPEENIVFIMKDGVVYKNLL